MNLAAGEGVIAAGEIGRKILRAEMDFDAIMHAMHMLSDVGENQKVRQIADFHLEPFAQQMVKKIIGLGKPRPKIAEIKSNLHFLLIRRAARRRWNLRNGNPRYILRNSS